MFSAYIVWYLFFAGVGSGCFVVATIGGIYDAHKSTLASEELYLRLQNGFILAPVCMIAASLFLLLDMGDVTRVWQALLMPFRSIVSLGAWFVVLFTFLTSFLALCGLFLKAIPRVLLYTCWTGGLVLAFSTMGYTGILLSSLISIDFWYTWLLPLLFIVSSLSTGVAAVLLIDAVFGLNASVALSSLWNSALIFGVLEVMCLAVFFVDRFLFSETARQSCVLLFFGDLAPWFWIGIFGCGIVLPLFIHVLYHKIPEPGMILSASMAVLVGGFCIRYCIVEAALYSPVIL